MKNCLFILLFCLLGTPLVAQELMITRLEYFIDSDPGVGNGTPVKITSGQTIDQSYGVPLGGLGLSSGFHVIWVRAAYSDALWGFYESRIFYVQSTNTGEEDPPGDIVAMEYFFDEDPGNGNGIALGGVPQGAVVDITAIVPTSLVSGWHIIGIRAKNEYGGWGFAERRPIYVQDNQITTGPTPKITRLEYFYNDDPGIGEGSAIDINPDAEVVDIASMLLPTSESIPVGTNEVTIRAQNDQGDWGFGKTQAFEVVDDCDQPTANFEVTLACAGETIFFTDLSTNLQNDATYRWYLNGDDEFDETNKGDVAFTYQNPGTYTVALAISQGQICYDSMAIELVVKAKPLVVFNADPVTVGESTNFDVTQYNVDPTAVWSWDFESDAEVDDHTVGAVSHTYPSAGDYQAEIVVTDNNGCGTSFSRKVTVYPPGGGGGEPVVNFQAPTVCLGEETRFTDLSQGIPSGSAYSWDFDGDGSTDDTAIGSPSFVYTEAGSFTAMLKVTLPDQSTLMHTEIVHVRAEPDAAFSAATVCIGETTSFVSGATGIDSNSEFSWDFDGDDVIDSDVVGDVAHTYEEPGQYSTVLTINNGAGCFDIAVRTVTVLPQPVADFTASEACAGEPVQFFDTSEGITKNTTYNWDFDGDGETDSTVPGDVSYVFPTTGDYTVRLTIDNGSGCSSTITKTIGFRSKSTPEFSASTVCLGNETIFTDQSTEVDESATYLWDFDGNGTIESQDKGNTSFTYTQPGTYTAILTINSGDCPSRTQQTVTVFEVPAPILDDSLKLCDGETALLNPGSGFTTYDWSDGSTEPTLEVAEPDVYSVIVTNDEGCKNTASVVVDLQGEIRSAFKASIRPQELSSTVTFSNISENADRYVWDFGDGTTSVEKNPVHEYQDINFFFGSVYEVCLTAFNDCDSEQHCNVVALIVTGQEEVPADEMRIFPNPAEEIFYLAWDKTTANTKIRMLDIRGTELWVKDFPAATANNIYEIDVHSVQSGQYIVEVVSAESVYRKKLIIN